jgi:hypothetical protein
LPDQRLTVIISLPAAVSLGGVSLEVLEPQNPELIPSLQPAEPYGIQLDFPEVLRHLKWMFQKAKLGQDMFLLGYDRTFYKLIIIRLIDVVEQPSWTSEALDRISLLSNHEARG